MGDNETVVANNEEIRSPNPKTPNLDKTETQIVEETKQLDQKLLDEDSSPNAENHLVKTDGSELGDPKNEVKSEPEGTQSEKENKQENATSEAEPNVPNIETKTENILKDDTNSELKNENMTASVKPTKPENETVGNDEETVPALSSATKNKVKYVTRNQSDILPSLRQRNEDASMMIFSHKGLPTKSYFKRSPYPPVEIDERDLPPKLGRRNKVELTPKISQTVPKLEAERHALANALSDRNPNIPTNPNAGISRNVLTGRGVSSVDEFKTKSARRKDGNPLLGIGYDEPVLPSNTGRVPPGGFSSGLW